MSDDAPDQTTLHLSRTYAADRGAVWRAWTEDLARWLWPERFATQVELEPRAGSAFHVWSPEVGMGVSGVVVEAEPSSRLVLTWRWDGEDEETLVRVELTDTASDTASDGGTALELRHEQHTTRQQRDDHVEGWEHCLQRLDAWLSRPSTPASGG